MQKSTEQIKQLLVKALELKHGGMSWEKAAHELGVTPRDLRRHRSKHKAFLDEFERSLLEAGMDFENWSHGWLKTEKVSVFVRNNGKIVSYEDIRERQIEEMARHAPKYPTIKRTQHNEPHLFVVSPADLHIGKLSVISETGREYNTEIALKRAYEGVSGLLEKAKGFKKEKILFVIGNDVLHRDTPKNTTTSGTFQDTDSMWHEAFIAARELHVKLIELLLSEADVDVVFNPSNHDYASGFMLADALYAWFHNSKNVTFDTTIRHRKYYRYGLNMIATSHGDGAKEADTPLLMASEEPDMWSKSKFRYIYLHHFHHKKMIKYKSGQDYHGVTIEYLRSPTEPDSWHDRQGFTQKPAAIEGFIHHPIQGQVSRITHYF